MLQMIFSELWACRQVGLFADLKVGTYCDTKHFYRKKLKYHDRTNDCSDFDRNSHIVTNKNVFQTLPPNYSGESATCGVETAQKPTKKNTHKQKCFSSC